MIQLYEWYVMPKIRIDTTYAVDFSHLMTMYARLFVTGWKGEVESEFNLKVSSFRKNIATSYDGNYMESFYQNGQPNLSYLKIPQNQIHNFVNDRITFNWDIPLVF